MKFLDLLSIIFGNLSRRKGRVVLTAIGVVIGTAAILVLVSLAMGLQQSATASLYGIGDLTLINVSPGYNFDEGMMMVRSVGGPMDGGPQTPITPKSLEDFAAMDGVVAVIPRDYLMGGATLRYNRLEGGSSIMGIGTKDLSILSVTAREGVLNLERGTAVIGSQVPMSFYNPRMRPGEEMPPPPDLMGKTIRLELMKWDQENTPITKTVQFTVAGVLEESRGESDWTIYVPLEDVTAWNEWFQGKRINRNKEGYNNVIVKVADVSQTLEISDQINALGYQSYTPQSFVEGINSFYVVLQIMFGGVGAIALLVAAIGIANTMAMAILERTREIGLMKAVGATNRDVLSIFLGEAAGIGFIGGLGGALIGWAGGHIIQVLGLAYMAQQTAESGGPPPSLSVYTPPWLVLFTIAFATLIGLLSGIYPALRAATLVPVKALKYE